MLKPFYKQGIVEAGCDEAGRGCIAGPVFAAAVILPEAFRDSLLNDSKKLSAQTRETLRGIIEAHAISFGVGIVSEQEIDAMNILNASILAMHRAIEKLDPLPDHLLIDGNRFNPFRSIDHTCVVRGDGVYATIAAASILAKTHRDEHMLRMHHQYGVYGWNTNKGYPTRTHREAVLKHGPSPCHRRSFRLLNEQMLLEFK
jgi:ribonuclease HII